MKRLGVQHTHTWVSVHIILPLLCVSLSLTHQVYASEKQPVITHHHLIVTLHPEPHTLTAEDTISFHHPVGIPEVLELALNKNLVIDETKLNGSITTFTINTYENSSQLEYQRLQVPLQRSTNIDSSPTVTIRYHGRIADLPKSSPGLRFTSPDNTSGYIGTEGIYLTSETLWIPTVMDTLATFQARVSVPAGWESITQGRQVSHIMSQGQTTSEWDISDPSEALTLAANKFVTQKRQWNGITIATYLFPEDAHLSEQYLDATAIYLDMYTKLLGPYPFPKFAVVENFFPAGIGLPSFTLLGNRIIKRGYTQPYSLGHEIVHSWFGNSVFNNVSKGNWVEGLTTYLSNYYYEEVHASTDSALKKRQQMFFEYNLYTTKQNEYPVRTFHHKETRLDNAIGYQKAAMLFHMLRQEVGEDNFFNGIRMLIQEWTGKHAEWASIEQVFSTTTGRNLSWFFKQWVDRPGTPTIKITHSEVLERVQADTLFSVNLTLVQETPFYRLQLPVEVHFADGTTLNTVVMMNDQEQTVSIPTQSLPTRLVIDPNFMVLRRFNREQIPPMLNSWVTDAQQALCLDENLSSKYLDAFQALLQRLEAQGTQPLPIADLQVSDAERSILFLGDPNKSHLAQQVLTGCGDVVEFGNDWISIQGKRYDKLDMAWLISCPHPTHPEHVVSVFYGFSPSAISYVARLLFFYGWDSYLVFQNGKVLTRGRLDPAIKTLDILFDAA